MPQNSLIFLNYGRSIKDVGLDCPISRDLSERQHIKKVTFTRPRPKIMNLRFGLSLPQIWFVPIHYVLVVCVDVAEVSTVAVLGIEHDFYLLGALKQGLKCCAR